jgi:hypothetical protein
LERDLTQRHEDTEGEEEVEFYSPFPGVRYLERDLEGTEVVSAGSTTGTVAGH